MYSINTISDQRYKRKNGHTVMFTIVLLISGKRTSSSENKTPPIGAPKATLTPAADAADRI